MTARLANAGRFKGPSVGLLSLILLLNPAPCRTQGAPSPSPALPAPTRLAVPTVPSTLPPSPPPRLFRIGYLRPPTLGPLNEDWSRRLRDALLNDPDFGAAQQAERISDVVLRVCDGPQDMLQRMALEEFEIVFCPAMVYAQERSFERNQYRVIFQTRRGEFDQAGTRGDLVRRRGALFVRRGSPLDRPAEKISPEDVKASLDAQTVAVSGSYDATCFYIRKILWEKYNRCRPQFLFCGSPQEAIKAVVSGLCDVGACEESALQDLFETLPPDAGGRVDLVEDANDFVRILERTQWMPTDPVLIHEDYHPSRSRVGKAAYNVLWIFYNDLSDPQKARTPLLERGGDQAYDKMAEDVKRTRGIPW